MRNLFLIMLLLALPTAIRAQDLETRLNERAYFVPTATSVREQLMEVAQHYKIPMGIEWVLEPEETNSKRTLSPQPTVRALLNSILVGAPKYSLVVRKGVVHVSDNRYALDSRNFLNLRIPEFQLSKGNVFDASATLRSSIQRTLHPERYASGMTSGYGYGVPSESGLDEHNISFSGKNLTVRDILDRIVLANRNTFWLVNLAPSTLMKHEPFFAQFEPQQERDFFWKIIPFEKK